MIPKLKKVSQHTFDRIGDQYAPYIDGEHFMGRSALDDFKSGNNPVKINYQEDRCIIRIGLPGFRLEDIHIHHDNESLYLRGVSRQKKGSRPGAKVNRVFSIPPQTDKDQIEATLSNGVLEIIFPKRPPRSEVDIKLR